jgi:hypothetical protein
MHDKRRVGVAPGGHLCVGMSLEHLQAERERVGRGRTGGGGEGRALVSVHWA